MVSLPLIIIQNKFISIRDHINIFPGTLVPVIIFSNILFASVRFP